MAEPIVYDIPYKFIGVILLVAVLVYFLSEFYVFTPRYKRLDEGFVSLDKGKMPDCFRTLPEAPQLLAILRSNKGAAEVERVEDTEADDREFEILLQKLACLKADLLSTERLPQSTRALPFETAHDRIPVAEVSAMCMSKNLSMRDIDIVFLTWKERAEHLLRKLCTERKLSEMDSATAEKLFLAAWDEVYQTSKSICVGEAPSLSRPQDEAPYEPESLRTRRSYDVTYGGLSASGWNANM
jgi:hypothetical protein